MIASGEKRTQYLIKGEKHTALQNIPGEKQTRRVINTRPLIKLVKNERIPHTNICCNKPL